MKHLVLAIAVLITVQHAHADEKQYFVKVNGQFKPVDKFEALRSKLIDKNSEVLACAEQRVTKKATLKAVSKNDD